MVVILSNAVIVLSDVHTIIAANGVYGLALALFHLDVSSFYMDQTRKGITSMQKVILSS